MDKKKISVKIDHFLNFSRSNALIPAFQKFDLKFKPQGIYGIERS
jgi:hypothetical protein